MSIPFGDQPVHLAPAERDALQAWVDDVKQLLALSDWRITVSDRQVREGEDAETFIYDQRDETVIALSPAWREWDAVQLRGTLTHELLHPHFQRVTALAAHLIENELGKRTEAVIEAAISEVEEQTIDRLARAIAKWLPVPEVPKGGETDAREEHEVDKAPEAIRGATRAGNVEGAGREDLEREEEAQSRLTVT